MDLRFETTATKLETTAVKECVLELQAELHRDLRVHTLVLVGTIVGVNGLLLGAARIF